MTDRTPLDSDRLNEALARPGSLWREIRVVPEAASTNALVAAEAGAGLGEGLVVVAEKQTAGRGRMGRAWQSPPGAGLTFSVLLRPDQVAPQAWSWLPLLAGVAIVDGISAATSVRTGLKWPNDVLAMGEPTPQDGSAVGRKLGGVLTEKTSGPDGDGVVVGIGINVTTTREELPIAEATSLALEGATQTDRASVLAAVLEALEQRYGSWRAAGGDATHELAAAYEDRCVTLGRHVRVELPGSESLQGLATAIDGSGRLVVVTEDGAGSREHALAAGDVVHVLPTAPTA